MTQFDESMAIQNSLEAFVERNGVFKIYTHSAKTRVTIMGIFVSYLVMFGFFVDFLIDRIQGLDDIPMFLAQSGNPDLTRTLFFVFAGFGMLMACLMLAFIMSSVVDIWGLQVLVCENELRVKNTITGPYFQRWSGVGNIRMEQIKELRGSKYATHVIGDGKNLRFSPVDQVDMLVSEILARAKNAVVR